MKRFCYCGQVGCGRYQALRVMKRAEIVEEARSWIGTPYEHMGRTKGIGVDCSQHVIAVAIALGYLPEDFQLPRHAPRPHPRIFDRLRAYLKEVAVAEAKPGDVLVLCFDLKKRIPQHMGFKTDVGICHLSPLTDLARVVEHHIDAWVTERIVSVWRFSGVED